MSTWYRGGTVSVTNGSPAVVGTDTLMLSQASIGDMWIGPDLEMYEITDITDDTHWSVKTLDNVAGYSGITESNQPHAVIRNFTSTTNATLAAKLAELLNRWHLREDELLEWLTALGEVTLTDAGGIPHTVKTPKQIQAEWIGTQAVTFSAAADITLTATQASNHVLSITGAEAGAVIVPLDEGRHWTVVNGSSLDRVVKVAGQTGVTVKSGRRALIRCGSADIDPILADAAAPRADLGVQGGVLPKTVTGGTLALTAEEASYAQIVLDGVLTADQIITVPDGTKGIWPVVNGTSGAYTVTLKTVSGTGKEITQNTVAFLRADGANVGYAHDLAGIELDTASSSTAVSSVMAADGVRTLVYTGATGTLQLPTLQPGDRVRVIKANATQGTVTISAAAGQTITRAALASVTLNADGDYWEILCVTSTRLELIDGRETGNNSAGTYYRYADGEQTCERDVIEAVTLAIIGSGPFYGVSRPLYSMAKSFVSLEAFSVFEYSGDIPYAWIGSDTNIATSTSAWGSLIIMSRSSYSGTSKRKYTAKGRWYN